MIMPCMNSTFFGEAGGRTAVVDAGNVFVGWPGAPGCTMTGLLGLASCAPTGSAKRNPRAATGSAIPISKRSCIVEFRRKDFMRVDRARRILAYYQAQVEARTTVAIKFLRR